MIQKRSVIWSGMGDGSFGVEQGFPWVDVTVLFSEFKAVTGCSLRPWAVDSVSKSKSTSQL